VVWEVLIWAIILMVVALILIYVFKSSLNKEKDIIEGQIGGAEDCDNDFVPNAFDKCNSTPKGLSVSANGCALNGGKPDTSLGESETKSCPAPKSPTPN